MNIYKIHRFPTIPTLDCSVDALINLVCLKVTTIANPFAHIAMYFEICNPLLGQVIADSIEGVQHSGIGGHEDFLAGAGRNAEGRSLVCLPSSAVVGGVRRPRIVASLLEGSIVTSPRHQVDVIVTEHGAAELAGRTVGERARALAEIAAPEDRESLRSAADEIDQRGRLPR